MSKIFHCILILLIACYLHPSFVFSEENGEADYNCSSDYMEYSGNKSFIVPLERNCDMYEYIFNTSESSSIFRISVTATPDDSSNRSADTSTYLKIYIQELEQNSSSTVSSWKITPDKPFENTYVSRSPKIRVRFVVIGNWTNNKLELNSNELIFDTFYKNVSENGNEGIKPWISIDGRSYRPNCVYILRISKPSNITSSNTMITLKYVDMDENAEEYMLIGAGINPFEGPPPMFIRPNDESKKYFINDENAYVIFVTGSAKRDHKGFFLTWEHNGTRITVPEVDNREDIKKAAPICLYNITAAKEELKNTESPFEEFKINLAEIASNYSKEKFDARKEENENISPSSISIMLSGTVLIDGSKEALYAKVKISKRKGRALFEKNELVEILDRYIQKYSQNNQTDLFQFRKCPRKKIPESWDLLMLYMIIPVVCCLFLLVWTWRNNPFTEHFAKKKRKKRASQHIHEKFYQDECTTVSQSVSQNPYTSLPKLQATIEQGRRCPMNISDNLLNDGEQSEDEVFNKMAMSRRSVFQERANVFSSKRPEVNQAFELEEEWERKLNTNELPSEQEQATEHFYDSLKSSTNLVEDDVTETKL